MTTGLSYPKWALAPMALALTLLGLPLIGLLVRADWARLRELTGRSRLIAYVRATTKEEPTVDGFLTFVYVDDRGKSRPHGITIEAETPEEIELQEQASKL